MVFNPDGSANFKSRSREHDNKEVLEFYQLLLNHIPIVKFKSSDLNNVLIDKLLFEIKKIQAKGWRVSIVLTPVIPGFEQFLLEFPLRPKFYFSAKQTLIKAFKDQNIKVIDFISSENFGCKNKDFIDETHATRECYNKLSVELN